MSEAPKEIWCSTGLYYEYKKDGQKVSGLLDLILPLSSMSEPTALRNLSATC